MQAPQLQPPQDPHFYLSVPLTSPPLKFFGVGIMIAGALAGMLLFGGAAALAAARDPGRSVPRVVRTAALWSIPGVLFGMIVTGLAAWLLEGVFGL